MKRELPNKDKEKTGTGRRGCVLQQHVPTDERLSAGLWRCCVGDEAPEARWGQADAVRLVCSGTLPPD